MADRVEAQAADMAAFYELPAGAAQAALAANAHNGLLFAQIIAAGILDETTGKAWALQYTAADAARMEKETGHTIEELLEQLQAQRERRKP